MIVYQNESKNCGVACLLSIIRYYGGDVSLDRLQEYTKTTKEGTDAYHLIEGAKKVGLDAKGIKCNIEDLKNIRYPCIAHVIINNSYQHYIVIYKIKNNTLKVMDPSCGYVNYSIKNFDKIWTKVLIILHPNKNIPIIKIKQSLNTFIINLIKPLKKEMIIILIISLIITLASIGGSYYFETIVNSINKNTNIYAISCLFLVLIIIKILSEYYRSKIIIFINKKIDKKLTIETYEHILSLPYKYYKNKTTGDILTRIGDLNYVKELISQGIITIFIDFILIFFSSIFLYIINKKMFEISIIIAIIYIVISIIFNKILHSKIEKNFEYQSDVNSYLIESISSYETIKGLNVSKNILKKFMNKFNNMINSLVNINKISNIQNTIKNIIDYIGDFLILLIGASFAIDKKITLGELITYNAIYTYFMSPIKNIVNFQMLTKKGIIALKRVNELYDIEKEKLFERSEKSVEFIGNIKIQNLNYTYNEVTKVLRNVNIEIRPNEKIMLTGPSGCGKSTLMKILLKSYECKRNKIIIDGIDINDYNLKDIRENIVYVSQQELLYNDTLFYNIDLQRDNSAQKINEICKITRVNNIIDRTPFGLDMLIEENGFNLSGGERQRIILGRTLLSSFKMLILDESTNQIDIELERKILIDILKKYKDKTIIFISHRENNMDLFDRSINLLEGET